jgi:hypothetical protein
LVLVKFREQSGLGPDQGLSGPGGYCFVGFEPAVAANVNHGVAALGQYPPNEQPAMAVGRILLAAHKRDAKALHSGLKASDGCLKAFIVAKPPIDYVTCGIVVGWVGRPSAQFRAQKKIADSHLLQRALQKFAIEMWNIP